VVENTDPPEASGATRARARSSGWQEIWGRWNAALRETWPDEKETGGKSGVDKLDLQKQGGGYHRGRENNLKK